MKRFDYYKVACCTPYVEIGDPQVNVETMLKMLEELASDAQLVVFPELCISGYSCQDLFYERSLLNNCLEALKTLCKKAPKNMAIIAGLPLEIGNHLYNAAAFIFNQKVLGFSLKTHLPGYNEFYEPRWFTPADIEGENFTIEFDGREVPAGNRVLFKDKTTGAVIGIEICEDLWAAIPLSSYQALAGANILCNCSASNELIEKDAYRKELVKNQSARQYAAYLYASAGPSESTMDLIFGGQNIIAENGTILDSSSLDSRKDFVEAEIDLGHLKNDRIRFKSVFTQNVKDFTFITYASSPYETISLKRKVSAYPFVPSDEEKRIERCQKILNMQAHGLATRMDKIHCKNVVLGVSGGLDSTLALLVCVRAFEILNLDRKGIHVIIMPGFGTTVRTNDNAHELARLYGTSQRTIKIDKAVLQHFQDIDHDVNVHDVTYENSQARERTQILMDIANQVGGIVIGTGDLSEVALGWSTYNGDHMSMYSVNSSIPKSLIRYIIASEALQAQQKGEIELEKVLLDICDTPVSPELLPPDQSGQIAQKTEEILGSYDLHDFFLYQMIRHHDTPAKIYALACQAYPDIPKEKILDALKVFYRRFFNSQFKRNAMPDGVKVGSVSLSQRGDWRMPSDATVRQWLKELENL